MFYIAFACDYKSIVSSLSHIYILFSEGQKKRLKTAIDSNRCTAKLNNLDFYTLEVVSRYRDPQLHSCLT